MTPLHATLPVGSALPPDYFSPGTYTVNGLALGSPWAIAFYQGRQSRFERAGLGQPWVRVS